MTDYTGRKIAGVLLAISLAFSFAGCKKAKGEKEYNITLITMDQMDVHWVSVDGGVKDAIAELEAEGYTIHYNWFAPDVKDNAKQIEQIDMATNNRSDVIMISANDRNACNSALKEAKSAGTKIIYIDSPADEPAEATFATDNYAGGEMAGKEMLRILAEAGVESGMIGIVSAQVGAQSCIDRVDGFSKVIKGSNFTLSEVQYSEGDFAKAQELGTNLINNGVVALYGANEGASVGAGNAARDAAKKIWCVGFDNSSAMRSLLKKDAVQAFMAQNPHTMGYEAMKAAVQILDGANLGGKTVDTGVSVVTMANVADYE